MGTEIVFDRGRRVYIDGAIDETMVDVRKELRSLALHDAERMLPIRLVICSGGGFVSGAFAVIDEIGDLQSQGWVVDGYVQGQAMSAAALILQACRIRVAGPNAMLMLHGSAGIAAGDEHDHVADHGHTKRIHKRMAKLVGRRTAAAGGMSSKEWREIFRSKLPHFYTAREALSQGLIDEIAGA